MHVLIIEDDENTLAYIASGLKECGNTIESTGDGQEGLVLALQPEHDVIIIDRMLPSLDGLALVKALRATGNKTPVIILSALGQVESRVEGLNAGADDYLAKPFVFSELLARVNALSRRPVSIKDEAVLRVADLELDVDRRIAKRNGVIVALFPREYTLLEILMRNEGRVVTRTMLLEQVWGLSFEPQSSIVETHISRLRGKIDKPFPVALLHTVRNMGYSLHEPR